MTDPKPRVVVLTGAGASKPLGLPTMEALLPSAFESLLQPVEEHQVFDMAANWAAVQNPAVLDFELVFTLVDTIARLRESDPVAMAFAAARGSAGGFQFKATPGSYIAGGNLPAYQKAAASLCERLKRVVHEQLAEPDEALAVKLYHDLFRVLGGVIDHPGVIDLFTTNYDRAVEVSHETAAEVDFELVKGFGLVGRARAPRWDPSLYDNAPGKRLTVKLYKLHGSLDWRRNGDVVEEVGADEYVKGRNALIYPIRKPVIEEPFTNLFERFKQRLQESGVCVVIGSSLRDEYIRQAIVEQLNAETLRVVLVDPNADKLAALLGEDLGALGPDRLGRLVYTVNARFGGSDDEVKDMEEKIRRAAAHALEWRQTP
jgi:hypothetical protein